MTCRKNPQLPPHKHKRVDGVLVCEGYEPIFGSRKVPEETKGYVPE